MRVLAKVRHLYTLGVFVFHELHASKNLKLLHLLHRPALCFRGVQSRQIVLDCAPNIPLGSSYSIGRVGLFDR